MRWIRYEFKKDSGSGLGNPDPDPGRLKMSPKKGKKCRNFMSEEISVRLEASPGV
jgi:hypothetical protein